MTDAQTAACIATSSWERMAAEAAEGHRAALREAGEALAAFLVADLVAYVLPGEDSETEAMVAEVRLNRAERRLGR